MAIKDQIDKNLPVFTIFCAAVSLIVYLWPALPPLLVYDRQAIQGGEWWRLGTACWVHFSASHLFWDLIIFVAAGWAIHAGRHPGWILLCCLTAVVPSLFLLLASPEVVRFGGLSGLATGAVVYLCLCELRNGESPRWEWLAILALILLKTGGEILTGDALFADTGKIPFRVLPSVHIIAFLLAVAVYKIVRPAMKLKQSFQSMALRKHHLL